MGMYIYFLVCCIFSFVCIRVNEVSVQYKCSSRQCFFHNLYPHVCFNSSGFIRPVFIIYLFDYAYYVRTKELVFALTKLDGVFATIKLES
jgi:hypothetical protein